MMRPRWKKPVSDLMSYKGRSLLVVAAIAIGTWGIGSILTSYVILEKDIRSNFLGTKPASATLWTSQEPSDELVAAVRALPAIGEAEVRQSVMGRMLVGEDTWVAIRIFVVKDFDRMRLATFTLEGGHPPGDDEILIERDGWRLMATPVGGRITLRLKDGPRRTLRISGQVHDPGQPPSHMDHVVYGYIGSGAYQSLLPNGESNELLVSVSEGPFDREHIRSVTRDLRSWLSARGIETTRIEVPIPGRHPHQGQLNSLLFLQGAIGLLSFVLCGVLIVNIMAVLLARQVRQIGIMKAIGATPWQVVGLYYFSVASLGALAALVGVPLGVLGGKAYAQFAARELNFNILTTQLPVWVYLALGAAAILMPILVATFPILKGTRVSVLQALGDHGLGASSEGRGWDAASRSGLPRPLLLSVRAAFRRRGRMLFTVGTLALGLTIFATALNLRATLSHTLSQSAATQRFDVSAFLGQAYPIDRVAEALRGVDGIQEVAYWQGGSSSIVYADGTESNVYPIVASPVPTRMLDPVMLAGTWFDSDQARSVVVNQQLTKAEEGLVVGRTLDLQIGARTERLRVVGIIKEMGALPTAYIPQQTWLRIVGDRESTTNLRIVASPEAKAAPRQLGRRLESQLELAGLDVSSTVRKAEHLQVIEDHLDVITNFLLASSLLALTVAGLGLISTMNINILERTRETGVMRAIGATLRDIRTMVLVEGLVVGVLSWVAGLILAIPLSDTVSNFFGALIFQTPLDLTVSKAGAPMSFVVMVVFVALATASAAAATARSSVRDALAYD